MDPLTLFLLIGVVAGVLGLLVVQNTARSSTRQALAESHNHYADAIEHLKELYATRQPSPVMDLAQYLDRRSDVSRR